jgi:hypothetical protein
MTSSRILCRKLAVRAIIAAILFAMLFAAIHIFFMYRSHERERLFMQRLEDRGGRATYQVIGPDWIPLEIRGNSFVFLHINYVNMNGSLSAMEMLPELKSLPGLIYLNLSKTSIRDEDMNVVSKLSQLKSIYLFGTEITDDGLVDLQHLKDLESVELGLTKTTPAGRKRLRQHLPNCRIQPDP